MLICFLYGRDQEINVIRLQEKTRTLDRVELNEGCEEQLLRIFAARQTFPSPALALMDVPGSVRKQMVAALVMGALETREVKLFSLTFE